VLSAGRIGLQLLFPQVQPTPTNKTQRMVRPVSSSSSSLVMVLLLAGAQQACTRYSSWCQAQTSLHRHSGLLGGDRQQQQQRW
jgi:hypothetical protein